MLSNRFARWCASIVDDLLSFKQRFCRLRGCTEDQFERRALFAMLHRRWAFLAPLVLRLNPALFRSDFEYVRRLGACMDAASYEQEVRRVRGEYVRERDYGFARRVLKLRLSGRRMLTLGGAVWEKPGSD